MTLLFPLMLAACAPEAEVDPREGTWVGTIGLDDGGSVDFRATLDVTVQEAGLLFPTSIGSNLSASASVSCDGVSAGGVAETLDTYDSGDFFIDVDSDAADYWWSLLLDGEVEGDAASGEGIFVWTSEADFSGTELPLDCQGTGEFTATRE